MESIMNYLYEYEKYYRPRKDKQINHLFSLRMRKERLIWFVLCFGGPREQSSSFISSKKKWRAAVPAENNGINQLVDWWPGLAAFSSLSSTLHQQFNSIQSKTFDWLMNWLNEVSWLKGREQPNSTSPTQFKRKL